MNLTRATTIHMGAKFKCQMKWNVTTLVREGGGSYFLQHFIAPTLELLPTSLLAQDCRPRDCNKGILLQEGNCVELP